MEYRKERISMDIFWNRGYHRIFSGTGDITGYFQGLGILH